MAAYLPDILYTVKMTNGTFNGREDIKVLEEIFLHFRATQYTLLAGAAIYFYDIFITLDDEILLMWSKGARKGLFMKFLYALNRYLPLCPLILAIFLHNPVRVSSIPFEICRHFFLVLTICHGIGSIIATTVFATRLWTVFHENRAAQTFLLCTLVLSHVALAIIVAVVGIQAIPTIFYYPPARICAGIPASAVGGMYITPIFIESVVAAMTLLHAIQFNKNTLCSVVPILNTLYLNGFVYYVIALVLRLGSVLVYYIASPTLIFLICYFEYALTSVVTSRSILTFRRVLSDTLKTGCGDTVTTMQQIQCRVTTATNTTGTNNNTNNNANTNTTNNHHQSRRHCSLNPPSAVTIRPIFATSQQSLGGGGGDNPIMPTFANQATRDSRSEIIECGVPLYRQSGETFVSRPWVSSGRSIRSENYYSGGRPSTSTSAITDTDATLLDTSLSSYSVGRAY